MGDGDRDDLLDPGRERAIGKDRFAEGFKSSLLVGRKLAPAAGDFRG
jgi:hypothetical protein